MFCSKEPHENPLSLAFVPLRFTSHFGLPLKKGEKSDLYYYNARWYDANTGRFISEDPIRAGSNWYNYCSNNPTKFIDPTGLMGEAAALAAAESGLDIEDSDSKYGHTMPSNSERNDKGDFDISAEIKAMIPKEERLLPGSLDAAAFAVFDTLPKEITKQLIELGIFENDFNGVLYFGTGAAGYYGIVGGSYEEGKAYSFTDGALTQTQLYTSVGAGFIPDCGANVYGVAGMLPGATLNEFNGLGMVASFGTSFPGIGGAIGSVVPNGTNIEGFEFFATAGQSLNPVDLNVGLTYTQKYTPQRNINHSYWQYEDYSYLGSGY